MQLSKTRLYILYIHAPYNQPPSPTLQRCADSGDLDPPLPPAVPTRDRASPRSSTNSSMVAGRRRFVSAERVRPGTIRQVPFCWFGELGYGVHRWKM